MAPDRETPFRERTEREIRAWVRGRDAGPAPERLRMRIASIAQTEPAPRRKLGAILRPAYAIAAAAAAVALVLGAMALRNAPGPVANPGSGSPAAGPTTTVTPIAVPDLPIGPWPRTGPVLAIPLDGALLAVVAVLPLVLALLIVARLARSTRVEARRAEFQSGWSWLRLWHLSSRRTRALRALAVLAAGALVAVGCGLLRMDQGTPLAYANWEAPGTANVLGYRDSVGGGPSEQYITFVPGGQVEVGIELSNRGDLPLTVTSFDADRFASEQEAGAFISSVDIRLPGGALMGGSYPIDGYAESFHPFEIPPGGQTSMWLVLRMKECRSAVAGPLPSPGASSDVSLPATGYVTFGELPFRYSVLGIEREVNIKLFIAVGLVLGSTEVTC